MIKTDQPTIFGSAITAAVSSIADGSMKLGTGDDAQVVQNRLNFLAELGVDPESTTLVRITYDTEDFAKYRLVTSGDKGGGILSVDSGGPASDALVVDKSGHALFLPLADCVGVIMYDPERRVLMVSHVGRHSAEITGGEKSARYLEKHFKVDLKDLRVWLSPGVGNATYPLHKFSGKSLHEVIVSQLQSAGVAPEHIEVSNIDTASDDNYFSHSQHLRDSSNPSGRFAVVAMIR